MHDAQSLWRRTPAIRLRHFAPPRPGLVHWRRERHVRRRAVEPTDGDSKPPDAAARSGTEPAASPPRTAVDTTFDLAPVGIMHLDKRGEPTHVNPELCELLGLSPRDLIGRPLSAVLHAADAAHCTNGLHRLITGRSASFVLEQRMRRRDGGWLWTQMNLAIVPGRDGADDYVLAIVTDISRQKRAEETARQTNERLDFVINRVPSCCGRSIGMACSRFAAGRD